MTSGIETFALVNLKFGSSWEPERNIGASTSAGFSIGRIVNKPKYHLETHRFSSEDVHFNSNSRAELKHSFEPGEPDNRHSIG